MTSNLATVQGRRPEGDADPLGVLSLVVWFGAVAGLLEPLILLSQNALGLRFEYVNPHLSWMSPLSYTVLFLAFVAPLFAFGRGRLNWLQSKRTATTLLSFLALSSILLLFRPEIHPVACALLALGAATQAWRALRHGGEGVRRFLSRTRIPVFGLIALSVGLQVVTPWGLERYARARLDGAATGRTNVVLIVLDTVRGANVSFNGYPLPTMDHLSRRTASGGVVFERAIATTSWSLPSHASLITGLYPHDLQVDWNAPLGEAPPTLAEVLRSQGYLTAGFFANRRYGGHHTGLTRGFHHWDADVTNSVEIFRASCLARLLLDSAGRYFGALDDLNQLRQKDGNQVTREFSE